MHKTAVVVLGLAVLYTPQRGEESAERLTPQSRQLVIEQLPALKQRYRALIFPDGALRAFADPPEDPQHCTFARVSINYSADLRTRVEACFFGAIPAARNAAAPSAPDCTGYGAASWAWASPQAI